MKNRALTENATYKFIKNDKLATFVGVACLLFTGFACSMGVFPKNIESFTPEWFFQISLNIATPIVLIGLGFIFPKIAQKTNN